MELYCIHLPEQEHRIERLESHLSDIGVPVELNVVEAHRCPIGSVGCALSHKKIVKYALDNKFEYITVIEDDIKFINNFDKILKNICLDLPLRWDIIVGGVSWVDSVIRYNHNLVKIGDFSGTQFMIYNNSSYCSVLKWNADTNKSIDRYLGELSMKGDLHIYCITPFISTQFSGYSTIRKKYTDDEKLFFQAQMKINEA